VNVVVVFPNKRQTQNLIKSNSKIMKIKEIGKIKKKAVHLWGEQAQIEMAIEEMAELIFALQKLKRKRGKPHHERVKDVQEEVADVILMMHQMRYIFGEKSVDKFIDTKMVRLKERLKESENGN
jgi:NTP pyrophosphatase (non-canonical NTP hydrolase)